MFYKIGPRKQRDFFKTSKKQIFEAVANFKGAFFKASIDVGYHTS